MTRIILAIIVLLFAGRAVAEQTSGGGSSITTTPSATTTTDASGTITAGGTFQQIAAASASRKSFEFSNLCSVAAAGACVATTDVCYIFFGANASATKANSRPISAGGGYLRSSGAIPSDAIQITCDGTGDKFQAAVQ